MITPIEKALDAAYEIVKPLLVCIFVVLFWMAVQMVFPILNNYLIGYIICVSVFKFKGWDKAIELQREWREKNAEYKRHLLKIERAQEAIRGYLEDDISEHRIDPRKVSESLDHIDEFLKRNPRN